jgi:hypothetical protein
MKSAMRTIKELMGMLWKEKMWWLIPMMLIMLVFVFIIVFGNSTGLGPFLYTLF